MKIIVTDNGNHFTVSIHDNTGNCISSYHFDTKKEVEAYCSGMQTARRICNSLVQDFPIGYENKKATAIGTF